MTEFPPEPSDAAHKRTTPDTAPFPRLFLLAAHPAASWNHFAVYPQASQVYVPSPIQNGRAAEAPALAKNRERLSKGMVMPKFVAIHAVTDVARWKSFDAERTTVFAPFATEVTSYTDPNGGKTVAVTANIHDVPGLQAFMQTPAAAAAMEKHGVIQPVTFLAA